MRWGAAIAAALAAVATADPAAAGVIRVEEQERSIQERYGSYRITVDVVTYGDPAGVPNDVQLFLGEEGAWVRDEAGVEPGRGCRRPDPLEPRVAVCERLRIQRNTYQHDLRAFLGAGDDRLAANTAITGIEADGGDGNDVVHADGRGATLRGGDGNDSLRSGGSYDGLDGGPGDDRLETGRGGGSLRGGPGRDRLISPYGGTAYYSDEGRPVVADLSDQRVIGPAAEPDTGSGLTGVVGGNAGDRLRGSSRADFLAGGGGSDLLVGGEGGDRLEGGAGADRVDGGNGNDILVEGEGGGVVDGGAGDDRLEVYDLGKAAVRGGTILRAGAGDDSVTGSGFAEQIDGGPGKDRLDGRGAADEIRALDRERDIVRCADNLFGEPVRPEGSVTADGYDLVLDCRRVTRSFPPHVHVEGPPTRVHWQVATAAYLRMWCPTDVRPRCSGEARLSVDGRRAGSHFFRVRRNYYGSARVRLGERVRSGLRERGCLRLRWSLTTRNALRRRVAVRYSQALVFVRPGDPYPGAAGWRPPC